MKGKIRHVSPRTSLSEDLKSFSDSDGNIKDAKHFNNVIGDKLFRLRTGT